MLDTPYLNDPNFLSCYVLTDNFWDYARSDLAYIKESAKSDPETGVWIWYEHEIRKFERIITLLEGFEENEHRRNVRRALYDFLNEYQFRKGIRFEDYCPEYMDFYRFCELTMLED
jgi:hypothetical protein